MKTQMAQLLASKINQNTHLTAQDKEELIAITSSIDDTIQQLAKSHLHDVETMQQRFMPKHKTQDLQEAQGARSQDTQDTSEQHPLTMLPYELKEIREDLSKAVQTFEVTHPELVELVNRLCVMLANLGI